MRNSSRRSLDPRLALPAVLNGHYPGSLAPRLPLFGALRGVLTLYRHTAPQVFDRSSYTRLAARRRLYAMHLKNISVAFRSKPR